jgi:hypothetical protein
VTHLGGMSIRQVPFRWVARSHRGMYRYFAKRTSPLLRPLLAAALGTRAVVKAVAAMVGPGSYDRGHGGARA